MDIQLFDQFVFGRTKADYEYIDIPLLAQHLYKAQIDCLVDCHATNAEICIQLTTASRLRELLETQIDLANIHASYQEKIIINFDPDHGTEWDHIEAHIKITKQQYIDLLERIDFRLSMYGFLPGFCYLTGLPTSMQIPRSSKPKRKIKANTLALGGEYIGIYGIHSPGGWVEIGKCDHALLDFSNQQIHSLSIGQIINFKSIHHG